MSNSEKIHKRSHITVFTDGCCLSNGKDGAKAGCGAYFPNHEHWNISVPLPGKPTNNRAEITAARLAIKKAREETYANVTIITDSDYLVNGATVWGAKWRKNGWKSRKKNPVANKNDWLSLEKASKGISVVYEYVPGHCGIPGNEKADALAKHAAKGTNENSDDTQTSVLDELENKEGFASSENDCFLSGRCHDLNLKPMEVYIHGRSRPEGAKLVGGCGIDFPTQPHLKASMLTHAETCGQVSINAARYAIIRAQDYGFYNLIIKTNNEYIAKGATIWGEKWRSNDWKTHRGETVKNKADWQGLFYDSRYMAVKYEYVQFSEYIGAEARRLSLQAMPQQRREG